MGERYIAWIDVETDGENPATNMLLEIAGVLTDMRGNEIGEPFSRLVRVNDLRQSIDNAVPAVRAMHEESGLWEDLWNKPTTLVSTIDDEMTAWLETYAKDAIVYFGGNSMTLDRRFMEIHVPKVLKRVSHQSVDVTSISLPFNYNYDAPRYRKALDHRALLDAYDSIRQYRHYLNWFSEVIYRDRSPLGTMNLKE